MPHLTQTFSAGAPCIDILVGISAPRQMALEQAGTAIPASIQVRGLIDTGADLTVIESSLHHQGFDVLIGRDILARCLLVYDGRNSMFSLAF